MRSFLATALGDLTMSKFPLHGLAGQSPAALSWLTGSWRGRNGPDSVEEHWSPFEGDSLMGMFRWVRDGKVLFYELVAIESEGELVRMRIKHFDPGLIGWEEKDRAMEAVLVHLSGREAAFLELQGSDPRWIPARHSAR